jgi:hypothetical protein
MMRRKNLHHWNQTFGGDVIDQSLASPNSNGSRVSDGIATNGPTIASEQQLSLNGANSERERRGMAPASWREMEREQATLRKRQALRDADERARRDDELKLQRQQSRRTATARRQHHEQRLAAEVAQTDVTIHTFHGGHIIPYHPHICIFFLFQCDTFK